MTNLPPGIPFSADTPINSMKRHEVAMSIDSVSALGTEDSLERWRSQLQNMQQWLCELLIINQQLRSALMEKQQLASTATESRKESGIRINL
jgi:hypothetical protein